MRYPFRMVVLCLVCAFALALFCALGLPKSEQGRPAQPNVAPKAASQIPVQGTLTIPRAYGRLCGLGPGEPGEKVLAFCKDDGSVHLVSVTRMERRAVWSLDVLVQRAP